MRLLAGPGAVLCLLVATACGGGGSTTPSEQPGGSPGGSAAPGASGTTAPAAGFGTCSPEAVADAPVISMEGSHALNPSDESTTVGGAVTWTNNSKTNHQIAFAGMSPCQFTLIGKSTSVTFSKAGSYAYVCKIHPTFMNGTITVQ